MRWKFTVILLLLNVAAAWCLYYLENRGDLQDRLDRDSRLIVPAINTIERLSIELRGENGETHTRVLARERDRWELLEPVQWPANENAVQNILTQLDFLSERVAIPLADIERLGQSLDEFGLAEPRVIIRYRTIEGAQGEIKVGSSTKMGRSLYLLPPGGQEVLVVQEDLLGAIATPLSNLRSHRIFDIPPFEIQSLAVQAGEQRIRLVRGPQDTWRFETPVSAPASSDLVENTLNLLYGQQALRLLPENSANPELIGLNNPRMRISIGGNNRRQTLLLGSTVPAAELPEGSPAQAYARIDDSQNQGTIFTVFEAPFEHLRQAPDQLRQRNFMTFDPAAVTSVQIQRSGASLTLQKLEPSKDSDAATWQAIVSNGEAMVRSEPVSALEVQRLLSLIGETSAVQFVSDSPVPSALATWGLDEPVAEVRLRGQNGLDTTLLLGKNVPEQPYLVYAKTRNNNTVYSIESRIFSALQTSPLAYRNRHIDALPKGAHISGLKLTDLADDKVLFDERISATDTDWGQPLADNTEAEREAILGLLETLGHFNVGYFLAEGMVAPEGMPWRYLLEVSLSTQDASSAQNASVVPEPHRYFFTARQGQTQVGASQRANMTFTLLSDLIDYLTPLTIGANPPAIPATTPQQVESTPLPPLPPEPAPQNPPAPPKTENGQPKADAPTAGTPKVENGQPKTDAPTKAAAPAQTNAAPTKADAPTQTAAVSTKADAKPAGETDNAANKDDKDATAAGKPTATGGTDTADPARPADAATPQDKAEAPAKEGAATTATTAAATQANGAAAKSNNTAPPPPKAAKADKTDSTVTNAPVKEGAAGVPTTQSAADAPTTKDAADATTEQAAAPAQTAAGKPTPAQTKTDAVQAAAQTKADETP